MDRRSVLAHGFGLALTGAGARAQAADLWRDDAVWLDDHAAPFQLGQLRGQASVVSLAYGACRRICSTSLRVMERVQALADARGVALQFVVVGLDASQDRPADWAELRAERRLQRANWHFLIGDDGAVRRLANRLGVRYWHVEQHVLHDFKVALVDGDGRPRQAMQSFDDPPTMLLP